MTTQDRVWTALPLFHIGGVSFVIAAIYAGATFVHVGPYNPSTALQQLRDEGCTIALPGFETIWLPIINHPDFADQGLPALRVVMCTGVPERLEQIQAATPHAPVVNCFGQTEACAFLSLNETDDPYETRMNSGGMPMPGMEVEIHDPDTDEVLPAGSEGELWYRGPMQFDGYFRDPETTAEAFDDRGFFKSGDVALLGTDGSVTFKTRVKDMLKVGGENMSPAEVEGYLLEMPGVADAAVVAYPDDRLAEVPVAYVVRTKDAGEDLVSEDALIDPLKGQIASYKIPRAVVFIDEMPMTPSGKIRKVELRARALEDLAD